MTKYFNKYILPAAFLIVMAGCQKKLDKVPEQSLSEDVALSSKVTAQSVLIGVYSTAQSINAFGSQPQIVGDFQSDNVEFVGSFPTLQEIYQFTTLGNNTSIQGWWQQFYSVILRANTIITKVPLIEEVGFTDAEKNQMVAEAKFLRALSYFELVNLFAQPFNVSNGSNNGVPLVTDAFEGEVTFPERASVSEIHAQIKKDLEEAIPALPASYASAEETRGKATKGACQALLSRLHLYRGEWTEAADRADEVLSNTSVYTLATDYSFYDGNTAEDIFSLQMTAIDNSSTGAGGWASYYRSTEDGGRGDCPFSTELENAFAAEPGDRRLLLSDMGTGADGVMHRFTLKYPDAATNTDNAPLIRVTEMYLNRAEALAERDGINQPSIDLVNDLRTRAGLPTWTLATFGTQQALINAILNERRKELCFEGHRRMDLLRKGQSLRTSGPAAGNSAPGDDKVILPIPQREVDINPSLEQNNGY